MYICIIRRVTSVCPGPKIQCPGKKLEWNDASSYILLSIFIDKLQLLKKKFLLVQKTRIIFLPFPMDVGCPSGRSSCAIANGFVRERCRAGEGKQPLTQEQQPVPGGTFIWSTLNLFKISFICQPTNAAANTPLLRLNWMHSAVCQINTTGLLLQDVIPSGFMDHPLSRNLVDMRSGALWWEVLLYYSFLVSAVSAKLHFHPCCGFGFQLMPNTKIDVFRCL